MTTSDDKQMNGQSLFEVVVAIAMSALIIVTIVSLVTNSLRNANFAKNNAQASTYAVQAIEWLRTERDTDIVTFAANVQIPEWCFQDLSWTISGACGTSNEIAGTTFLRNGTFSTSVISGKTVYVADITVSWTDAQGIHQVTNSTDFTDWRQR